MSIQLNFTPFEKKVNFLILLVVILLAIVLYLSTIYESPLLSIIKLALEASLVGAIADSYAVFGLFHRLGPHTDILRRKRVELTERVIQFVSYFLFDKEVLRRELERLDLAQLILNIDRQKIVPFLEETLRKILEDFLEITLKGKNFRNQISYPSMLKLESIIDLIIEKIVNLIKESLRSMLINYLNEQLPVLIETIVRRLESDESLRNRIKDLIYEEAVRFLERNHYLIEEIARKRLSEIPDEEYLLLLKRASWDELQWIRLNGMLLGFVVGLVLGLLNVLLSAF